MYRYVYQYKDNMENIRLAYSDRDKDGKVDVLIRTKDIDGDGDYQNEIKEVKDYYPFGSRINYGINSVNSLVTGRRHNYGFGAKEEQNELGLEWIDISARNYNPALGRWMNTDPLSDKFMSLSPYLYSYNNPTLYFDPDGMEAQCCRGDDMPQVLENVFTAFEGAVGGAMESFGKAAGELIAGMHPLVNAMNIYQGVTTGTDNYGNEMSKGEAGFEIATSLPVTRPFKALKYADEAVDVAKAVTKNVGSVVLEKGAKYANEGEKAMVGMLAKEGKNIKVLAESTQKGVKSADFMIDGVKTELKTISNITSSKLSNAIKKRILSGANQSGNLIIDVTGQNGASKDVINEALNRAFGSSDKIKSVRVIGEGFDITRSAAKQ